jgi:hypothetical protein
VAIIFVIQNIHAANISFLGIHLLLPLVLALFAAAMAGSLTIAAGPARIVRVRKFLRAASPGPLPASAGLAPDVEGRIPRAAEVSVVSRSAHPAAAGISAPPAKRRHTMSAAGRQVAWSRFGRRINGRGACPGVAASAGRRAGARRGKPQYL